ncbi:MAG: UDP-N-acetylglucosamine 1-carboxyvinyltransferase [Patescibacteria group bacterium]
MSGEKFVIQGLAGKRKLNGEIKTNGSKNDAVQAIAAAFLFRDRLTLTNLPEIDDVDKMLMLIAHLGARVKRTPRQAAITVPEQIPVLRTNLDTELAQKIRASILLLGPLIGRYGAVTFPHPGGCVIGERPIDLFLSGFRTLGAMVSETDQTYTISAPQGLVGAEIFFRNISVTATETFILAAVFARGQTVLKNCALEPEIENLGRFLVTVGAKIDGLGTSTITINGTGSLTSQDHQYQILPDRIEAGSFLILGALAGKKITVTNCEPVHLESLLQHLILAGASIAVKEKTVTVAGPSRGEPLQPLNLKTHEYPGFPTDLQAPFAILLTQAAGHSAIFETIFGGRLLYLETLNRMGAETKILNPHEAAIDGPTPLKGQTAESPDLRAGLAYLLAGVIAAGETIIHNIHYIDRGYERIDERLRVLGVAIKRC